MNNPPAFPNGQQVNANGEVVTYADSGMTLRDWFAGKIVTSLGPALFQPKGPTVEIIASNVYHLADAMLAEREKAAAGGQVI